MALAPCPLCGILVQQEELEAHVQNELAAQEASDRGASVLVGPSEAGGPAGTEDAFVLCEVCDDLVPLADLASHSLAHQLEAADWGAAAQQQQQQGASARAASAAAAAAAADGCLLCPHCGCEVPLADAESHLLAHELQSEDVVAADAAAVAAAADQEDAAQLEAQAFEELRARYGFSEAPSRPGACRLCGEEGHWVRECPRNPDVAVAKARVIVAPTPAKVAASQQPTEAPPAGDLVGALVNALGAQALPPACKGFEAAVCAPGVVHYGASPFDAGWGCGYRNIQMQAAHLMHLWPEARERLFGGAGFVPDIPALQAWMEVAWSAGFDRAGCDQLGGAVQGTHKWIGTTEAAALLRYWGLRAHIADFGLPAKEMAALRAAARASEAAAAAVAAAGGGGGRSGANDKVAIERHVGVQCDGCGVLPILGPRYRSETRHDYDLCAKCHTGQGGAGGPAGPFTRMMVLRHTEVALGGAGAGGNSMQEALVRWIWRYFTDSEKPAAAGAAGSLPHQGGDAAGEAAVKRPKLGPGHQLWRVEISTKPALYIQHEGHSRTVIGVERRMVGDKDEFSLLMLDPGVRPATLANVLREGKGWQRFVLWVEPGLASGDELEAMRKVAASEVH
eukprot:scaffold2.g7524.t1